VKIVAKLVSVLPTAASMNCHFKMLNKKKIVLSNRGGKSGNS